MKLTDEQKKAISHDKGPALVLAVPGSGKTTMLLSRTKGLIEAGEDPARILTITFSRAAAKDMQLRYRKLFYEEPAPSFSTIHSFCFSVLKNYERRSGIRYTLIETAQNIGKWRILADLWREYLHRSPNDEQLETLIGEIGYVKNKMLDPDAYQKQARSPLFTKFYRGYESLKRSRNWIDFDDMIALCPEIFQKDPGLLRAIRRSYDYVQLDEGQDTSRGQLAIVDAVLGAEKNLFVVADDDQSIYGFRGADFQGLMSLKDRYQNLKIYYLSRNFRSTESIIAASTRFIEQNKKRYSKDVHAVRESGVALRYVELDDLKRQYAFIASEIQKHDLKDVAVLYRNHISAVGCAEYFERKNIAFSMREGKIRFLRHRVVKDLLEIVRFAQDPRDLESFSHIYYKIRGYISKKMVEDLARRGVSVSVFDTMLEGKLPDYMRRDLQALRRDFMYLAGLPLAEAFRFIQKDLEYEKYLENHANTFGSSKTAAMRILYYAKFIAKNCADADAFMARLQALDRLLSGGGAKEPGIVLSTLHGAKGLEFDAVFLIDLNEDVIPARAASDAHPHEVERLLEEERRLFYVGMTRARHRLYFLRPRRIDREVASPSPFFTWAKEDILRQRKNRS